MGGANTTLLYSALCKHIACVSSSRHVCVYAHRGSHAPQNLHFSGTPGCPWLEVWKRRALCLRRVANRRPCVEACLPMVSGQSQSRDCSSSAPFLEVCRGCIRPPLWAVSRFHMYSWLADDAAVAPK